ncbi:MAG: AMP-dependent synthetase/ligase, partial [Actinomycetota bacterium]|nr:AMP-dependent synthetase/ligase [Actinomycetota bacterium]
MREYVVPPLHELPATGNASDFLVDSARSAPTRAILSRRAGGEWQDVTAQQFLDEVRGAAKGLIASGIGPGDRVGLMAKTRYEWTLLDFAIWFAGGVVVPIYETSSAEQVQWILSDAGAAGCIVETAEHAALVAEVRESVPDLRHLWEIEGGAVDSLRAAGSGVADDDLEDRRTALGPDDVATIIYTSGTMGRPKGCELTHGNFVFQIRNIADLLPELFRAEGAATLLFLPLAHVFARAIQLICVYSGVRLAHTADVKNVLDDLGTFQPTFILAVPRVFEKVYNRSQQKAEAGGKGKIFHAAAETAVAYSEALDKGRPGVGLRLRHALFDRLVYGKLRAALGGRTRYAVSGGAPLGARLGHFFRGVGLTVIEGYGLTETTAPATANRPRAVKMGTVGQPVPGAAVRVADDGEVLVKGPVVFRRYFRNEDATREAFTEDGWLRTGDLGELDDEGFLRIVGRKKELLVTAAGKNVAPSVLEDRLRSHPLVSQCIVVGDARPYIAALVTIDEEALPGWLEARGKERRPLADLVEDADLVGEVQSAVDSANKAVSRAEAIKRFRILTVDFTEAGGQLTPKQSLKRAVVLKE